MGFNYVAERLEKKAPNTCAVDKKQSVIYLVFAITKNTYKLAPFSIQMLMWASLVLDVVMEESINFCFLPHVSRIKCMLSATCKLLIMMFNNFSNCIIYLFI